MKVVAGMGSVDDYEALVNAGADEVFIGYVPIEWIKKYGKYSSLNRREVLYYNVQIGSFSELLILRDMVKKYKVPVTIAFNSLSYKAYQYQDILDIIYQCVSNSFFRFIIADIDLIKFIQANTNKIYNANVEAKNSFAIHLSGEFGQLNELVLASIMRNYSGIVKRIIFPRQTTLDSMDKLSNKFSNNFDSFEAFILNEKCEYTGAYCNGLHCDEMCHICQIPFRLDKAYAFDEYNNVCGESGCGLCYLWELNSMKVEFLKVVGRGNDIDSMKRDIRTLKNALSLLDACNTRDEFKKCIIGQIFDGNCSGNCYYYDV